MRSKNSRPHRRVSEAFHFFRGLVSHRPLCLWRTDAVPARSMGNRTTKLHTVYELIVRLWGEFPHSHAARKPAGCTLWRSKYLTRLRILNSRFRLLTKGAVSQVNVCAVHLQASGVLYPRDIGGLYAMNDRARDRRRFAEGHRWQGGRVEKV